MSPAERIHARLAVRSVRLSSPDAAPVSLPAAIVAAPSFQPLDTAAKNVLVQHPPGQPANGHVLRVKRRGWRLEEMERHWYQCFWYPLRAWLLVLGFAVLLTGLSVGIALVLPRLLADFRADSSWLLGACLLCVPFFLILSYVAGFLDCTLISARSGEVQRLRWPGRDVSLALQSGARWLLCLLAGPMVPAGAALLFWIHGGDLFLLDWIILVETVLLAIGCWFLLVWAVNEKDRLRALHPVQVGEFIHRLGLRMVALAIAASGLALAHAWWASVAVEKLHQDVTSGWGLLFLCWASGMFSATFLFRWVGVWLYWDYVGKK